MANKSLGASGRSVYSKVLWSAALEFGASTLACHLTLKNPDNLLS